MTEGLPRFSIYILDYPARPTLVPLGAVMVLILRGEAPLQKF